MTFSGRIVKKTFGKGSKSEHEAIFLVTGDREYVVRRQGQNPFEPDLALQHLVGKTVTCSGIVRDYVLYVDTCIPLEEH